MITNKAVIILSRLDSTRFPNKALKKLGNKTLIEWCITALMPQKHYKIVLATTNREVDNPLIEIANKYGIQFYRGDCDNVALRVKNCLEQFKIDIFARVNGDSPFPQRELIEEGFKRLENDNLEFVTNLAVRSFPYGISVEILRAQTYLEHYKNFHSNTHKEHVTSYFYENLKTFNFLNIDYGNKNDHNVRLVVDTPEDYLIITQIADALSQINNPTTEDLVKLYKKITA
ncbi:MAG: hypothetical protein KKG99_12305 [Bacteroidetes bacterium]|nr:hypothetical protein [Bacteroidota bacterium]